MSCLIELKWGEIANTRRKGISSSEYVSVQYRGTINVILIIIFHEVNEVQSNSTQKDTLYLY